MGQYACDRCGASFDSDYDLTSHFQNIHNAKSYEAMMKGTN